MHLAWPFFLFDLALGIKPMLGKCCTTLNFIPSPGDFSGCSISNKTTSISIQSTLVLFFSVFAVIGNCLSMYKDLFLLLEGVCTGECRWPLGVEVLDPPHGGGCEPARSGAWN